MITGELKSKVDKIWDTMWSGGISNPLSVIEQLTYLLFIKRLDELHTLKERKAARTGTPIQAPVFAADQNRPRWSRFKDAAPEQMFETVRDEVFPFIKSLGLVLFEKRVPSSLLPVLLLQGADCIWSSCGGRSSVEIGEPQSVGRKSVMWSG